MAVPEKDPLSYGLLTYAWVIGLSMTGGLVSFMRKMREGKTRAWNIAEFIGEVVTAGFSGLLTFYLCEAGEIEPLMSAAMVGISGHMGSRLIFQMESWLASRMTGGAEK